MKTVLEFLVGVAMWAGIVWPAVFLGVYLERHRRRFMPRFLGDVRCYLPKQQRVVWWRGLPRLPLSCVFMFYVALVNFLILPPMFIVELPARLRARAAARH